MNERTLELLRGIEQDSMAREISHCWDRWNNARQPWLQEKKELRDYVFATDTTHTTASDNDLWSNRTTTPKLCQIRDNLHANYISALFPNDDWLKWEGYNQEAELAEKREAIQYYMSTKCRQTDFRTVCSQLLYDYIDTGLAIADVEWVYEVKTDPDTGKEVVVYVGPKAVRCSVFDVVFDPTAVSFDKTPKIKRSMLSLGELELMAKHSPEDSWEKEAAKAAREQRHFASRYSVSDFNKLEAYTVDGFNTLYDYYNSGYVEILEMEGSVYSKHDEELLEDHIITIVDRSTVVRQEPMPHWKRGGMKVMSSWRKRPDNLYGMGPLDNLVGLQYRLDHLENAKADAWDLIIEPMWKIVGDVPEFEFRPGGSVVIPDQEGDVVPMTKPTEALAVNTELAYLMNIMEEMAGAPKQAMGIRTPGEKTAYEVQTLENAAGRIFQEKITQFEIEILEPLLNNMLEVAVQNMGDYYSDVVRVFSEDDGVPHFINITKEDIRASGILRPIGARHFASRAQLLQNLAGLTSSGVWPKVQRHFSDLQLAKLVEDALSISRYDLVSKDAALYEEADSARVGQALQEQVAVEQATPEVDDDEIT